MCLYENICMDMTKDVILYILIHIMLDITSEVIRLIFSINIMHYDSTVLMNNMTGNDTFLAV